MDKIISASLGAAVFFMMLAGFIIPSFQEAQGQYTYEDVTDDWSDVIVSDQSTSYSISNGTVTIQDGGDIQTQSVVTQEHQTFSVDTSVSAGTASITVYDASDDSQIASGTSSLTVDGWNGTEYYLEITPDTTTALELDSYQVTAESERDPMTNSLIYLVMILLLVGIGYSFYRA